MPKRRKEEPSVPFDYDEAYAGLAQGMTTLHLARVAELPTIDLYLDQVLSLVSQELAPLYDPHEKIVTGSMVNNYVKQGVVPRPVHKRYTRRHLTLIIMVCMFKRVLSIAQVTQMVRMVEGARADIDRAYDELMDVLEQALASRFPPDPHTVPVRTIPTVRLVDDAGEPLEGHLTALFESGVSLVADKVHVSKLLDLDARRELEATRGTSS